MLPFVFAFPMIVCAPVAIYFGFNFNLPTPSVYFLPAKLLCCCSEKRARALVLFTDLLVCFGCRQFLCFSWSVCCVCLFSSTICCYCECDAACVEFDVSHLHHGLGLHSLCIYWYPKVSQEQCWLRFYSSCCNAHPSSVDCHLFSLFLCCTAFMLSNCFVVFALIEL